jgi:hypothetical protein
MLLFLLVSAPRHQPHSPGLILGIVGARARFLGLVLRGLAVAAPPRGLPVSAAVRFPCEAESAVCADSAALRFAVAAPTAAWGEHNRSRDIIQ